MLDKNQNSNLISRRYIDEFEEDLENDDYNVNSEFQKTPVNEVNNNLSKMDDSEPYIMTIQLDTKTDKIKSKGVESVESRVTNLLPYFKEGQVLTINKFKHFV